MIIEGTLGITASHFLLDFLRERGLLPGFVDGYGRIAADEQRHIAYGTQFLQQAVAEDPQMADVVRAGWSTCFPPSPSPCRRRARARGTCSGSRTASWRSTGSTRSPGGSR